MDQLAQLPEAIRNLALERFRIIQPHLEQSQSLQSIARASGIPYRTAQRWVAAYRRFGLLALARKQRDDQGGRRVVSPATREMR